MRLPDPRCCGRIAALATNCALPLAFGAKRTGSDYENIEEHQKQISGILSTVESDSLGADGFVCCAGTNQDWVANASGRRSDTVWLYRGPAWSDE